MKTGIDRLHETPGHVASAEGCADCRTWARVVLGNAGSPPHPDMHCSNCGAQELAVYRDIERLRDFVPEATTQPTNGG